MKFFPSLVTTIMILTTITMFNGCRLGVSATTPYNQATLDQNRTDNNNTADDKFNIVVASIKFVDGNLTSSESVKNVLRDSIRNGGVKRYRNVDKDFLGSNSTEFYLFSYRDTDVRIHINKQTIVKIDHFESID